MVVRGCCLIVVIATSCSSPLPPVTADLLGWSSAIWRYTKSHYSVGHGLDEEERNIGWGMIKEGPHSPHTNRLTGRQRDGGGKANDLILGEKEVKFRMFVVGHWTWICICLLFVYVYIIAAAQTHIKAFSCARDCVLVFVYEHMLCVCVRVRMPRPIWAPRFLSAPSGPAAEREWVSHPADERVKVKALPSQKNITRLPCSLFEVIQEEGGKRHTFSIALKHGVRQLPSCCTL